MKRIAQITAFVIIALVVVVIIIAFFSYRANIFNIKGGIPSQVQPVYTFAENCLKKTAEESIYQISSTGGYLLSPNLSTENHIAYYLYDNKNYMPKKEAIQEELARYVNEMVFFCTKNFDDFSDFNVKQEVAETTVEIKERAVVFNVNYPLSIEKDNRTYYVDKFAFEIPVNFDKVYTAIEEIMAEQMKNTKYVCISCIGEIADKKELSINIQDYKKNVVIFDIVDRNSRINEQNYEFLFANFYENE